MGKNNGTTAAVAGAAALAAVRGDEGASSSAATGDVAGTGADLRAGGDDAEGEGDATTGLAASSATLADSSNVVGGDAATAYAEIDLVIAHLSANGHDFDLARSFSSNVITVIDGIIGEKAEMVEIIETLRAELVEQTKALDAANASLTKAAATIKERTVRPPRARRAGPLDEPLSREALRDRLANADDVEIVFSDGARELLDVASIDIAGPVWRESSLGLLLDKPVDVKAPHDNPPVTIAGVALFIDGKQAAYQRRSDPLTVPAGQCVRLENDIIF